MNDIFFDLDGTIINFQKRHYTVYKKIIKTLRGRPLPKVVYWGLKKNKANIKDIITQSNLSISLVEKFRQRFFREIETKANLKLDKVFPYAFSILKSLKLFNCSLFIVSFRHSPKDSLQQVKNLGLDSFFADIKIGRVSAEGYQTKIYYIKKLRDIKNEGFVVGDTEDDIIAAKLTGLTSVAVLSGIRNLAQLKKYKPDYLIKDIRNLPDLVFRE